MPDDPPASDNSPGRLAQNAGEADRLSSKPQAERSSALIVFQRPSIRNGALRQCEVLSDAHEYRRSLASLKAQKHELEEIVHPFAVVMSQDCDLEQDHDLRFEELAEKPDKHKLIQNVLLLQAVTVEELQSVTPPGKDIWKRIKQNKDERYHLLEAVDSPEDADAAGVPALGIDFKQFFTIPTEELHFQLGTFARRRYYLESPYLEDLTKRFADYLSRVALPRPHSIK
jgi:hypothetical protein